MGNKLPPLYAAIVDGDSARVKKALTAKWYKKAADVNGDDTDRGCSPLQRAVEARQRVIVRQLLRHKPRPDVNRVFAGETAMDVARRWGNEEIINLLKDAGALTLRELKEKEAEAPEQE